MSNTDSFIDEVTEEVRRDRLFRLMKRYGWIAVLGVLLIVGGTAWREWSRAQERAAAQAFGDSIVAALETEDSDARLAALRAIDTKNPRQAAILKLLTAAELVSAGNGAAAVETLRAVAEDPSVPQIYRQIAAFKALARDDAGMDPAQRRVELEALAQPGNPMRLLAEEQLALIDIETGRPEDAIARLKAVLEDAEVTAGLRQRATQLIVALGGDTDAG